MVDAPMNTHSCTQERALDYIWQQAGKHFDPAVVDVFLHIVDNPEQD